MKTDDCSKLQTKIQSVFGSNVRVKLEVWRCYRWCSYVGWRVEEGKMQDVVNIIVCSNGFLSNLFSFASIASEGGVFSCLLSPLPPSFLNTN